MNAYAVPVLVVLMALVVPADANPCGRVSREGLPIYVKGEEALIVWDAEHHLEHFIRKAIFDSAPSDFGFLVPTPSRPTLAESDESVFDRLSDYYFAPVPRGPVARGHGGGGGGGHAVQVISVQYVANMEATVVRATDATALGDWLSRRGYQNPPSLARWLQHFVHGEWHIIAFRYVGVPARFGARAVRITFATPEPMYPYSEPDDAPQQAGRVLRVTVLGNQRVEGRIASRRWASATGYAHRFAASSEVLSNLFPQADGRPALPAHEPLWMTTFEESDSRRGADELYFVRAGDQGEVAPSLRRRAIDTGSRSANSAEFEELGL